MRVGDIISTKSITHREVVDVREGKDGKQKVSVNQFGFKFQSELNLLSTTGVFLFLGTFVEANGPDAAQRLVERQLERLGWVRSAAVPQADKE